MSDGWSVVESPFRVEHARAYEGLFTLGSGYLHVRGSLEEHLSDAPQDLSYTRLPANVTSEKFPATKAKWGTYVAGIFGRHPLLNSEMINLPWFLGIVPRVDGQRLDLEQCTVEDYRRELRMDTATLVRTLRWRTASNKTVDVCFERFVSAVRPYLCVQRMTLTPGEAMQVDVEVGIDANVRTNGYDHFIHVETGRAGGSALACFVHTDAHDQVGIVTQATAPRIVWKHKPDGRTATLRAELDLPQGKTWTLEKRTAVQTTRDLDPWDLVTCLTQVQPMSFEELHAEHAAVWRSRWAACDVIIEGDPDSQRAMRTALFHLLRAHVPGDSRVAIDAKGYSGDAYWGRFFWDTEMYLLPFYLYTDPPRARTLAEFRVQSLDGARANARRYGYDGARYPWESDSQGNECCPNWQYADHEIHVTADVVYGLSHFARATGADEYLRGPAAEVVVETARYWLQRVDRRPGDEGLSLLAVMGPDEYVPISSNNSYTNRLASFALALAAEVGEAGGASPSERTAFAEASQQLDILRAADGELVLQCEEFERLAEPRFDELWKDRSKPFASQVSQERLYRSKCLKQADVLMLMTLFPDEFTDQQVRRAWDYYLPYTTHDSSLSPGAHAIVAVRLGRMGDAWRFWVAGRALDLDVTHGGAAEGIHIANAAAVWQMAVQGFAGMRTAMQSDVLTLRPRLPEAWTRLAFPIVWKGCPAYVDANHKGVTVANRGPEPLAVTVYGRTHEIPAGGQQRWEVPA
ncbi:MAG: glycoside hydrolase family 65 protein [Phycisphaerae bacterium]|nr:glycoside hydrolase family 65 protein [Phycisphaerae bacterium]